MLRALDEAGIEISMIAGTSIGALVGGCYLAGKLDQLEEFARSLTKRRIFGLLDFNFGGNGLFGGMKLDARMQQHMNGMTFRGSCRSRSSASPPKSAPAMRSGCRAAR